jgi:endoglucanase
LMSSLIALQAIILATLVCVGVALPNLKVSGNRLVDPNGNTVILHGVDRSGTEFACVQPGNLIFNGPNDQASVTAMKTWNINAVRIPLNEDCWLGINGLPPSVSGKAYQTAVADFVNLFLQNDVYVILDLHWTANGTAIAKGQEPMPNTDHSIDFWKSVATYFKGNDAIIFDLFNEPYPNNGNWDDAGAWKCWRDGGGNCTGLSFEAAGMQSLVNAVRSVGATNVVMLGGLAWSNSFAQWMTYLPTDPLQNTAGSWHSYNFNYCNNQACWQQYVLPVAQKYPIIIGEMGENDCQPTYITALMSWADQNKLSYLGWTWNNWDCSQGPSLITDYSGTPTAFGAGLKAHLQNL